MLPEEQRSRPDEALPLLGSGSRRGEPLRLLWLIDSLTLGGAEALTATFARAVDPAAVGLRVACLKTLGGNPFTEDLHRAGYPPVHLRSHNLRDLPAFRRLLRLVRGERIELIHAHLAYASIWGTLAGRLTGVPALASLHLAPAAAPAWTREGLRRRLLVGLLNRWATALAVSDAVRRAWVNAGLDPDRVLVVHNGVAPPDPRPGADERARVRRHLGLAEHASVLVALSALRPGKGLEVLIAALPALLELAPETRLLVAGDGPLRPALAALAASTGVDGAVVWAGFRRDVPALLAAADLFVAPSLEDAFPTSLLEAMTAGLPVVASRTGGIPEIVVPGKTGLLVPPGDPGALAGAMAALLADPVRRAALGAAGRRRVEERFSAVAWVERLTAVYRRILSPSDVDGETVLPSGRGRARPEGGW
ncbi:MAG TPA: glycosyltransferase [Thermoanaerobaculia bacterium]|nr:glycosyltransferase [Thermoanaerobaculia bacterium]